MTLALHVFFFLSGAAALIYEVTWARTLSLVFGGSHLAVTTVLTVFMGGLALGSALLGRRADRSSRPLRLYGFLEIGVAAGAALFMGLIGLYPAVYPVLARAVGNDHVALTVLRALFGALAMIVPTTLMGGTLPVLARLTSAREGVLRRRVAALYAINTLGAVAGVLVAGFFLLATIGVRATVGLAAAINICVGAAALVLSSRTTGRSPAAPAAQAPRTTGESPTAAVEGVPPGAPSLPVERLVLWGIGISGFCALGYEVLWTRALAMVVGTSAYNFAIILAAFLTGIALGSAIYAGRRSPTAPGPGRSPLLAFGLIEAAMGAAALGVTVLMGRLPEHAVQLQTLFLGERAAEITARQWSSIVVALAYMIVPALLSGAAFPMAASIVAARRRRIGGAVGDVAMFNTIGAIAGSAVSGFALIHLFGIERSLLLLVTLNVGLGAVLVAGATSRRAAIATGAAAAGVLALLATGAGGNLLWNPRYFAIFMNNQREVFESGARIARGLELVDVLYYHEGANETISVIRPRGGEQRFVVNARIEATTTPADVQCQYALGHVPMLLHPHPRRVFVLGTGSGMTLGATTVHPEVESVVLAEIEPAVLPATRTFGEYNHRALDNPQVSVCFNDGRNYLATTSERFDVITADPIHPWSGGASYLYTDEYFRLAASRLNDGGIIAQWLPLYELTPRDVATVVKTFAGNFKYVMVWLTYFDAELIGSNSPIVIDPAALARRASVGAVARDLASVNMAGAEGLLEYFLMGERGARAFAAAAGGVVNTDDNLFLEFSAPRSMGVPGLVVANLAALAAHREPVTEHLAGGPGPDESVAARGRLAQSLEAGRLADRARVLLLDGRQGEPQFGGLMRELATRHPDYAPGAFLRREIATQEAAVPRPLAAERFTVTTPGGGVARIELTAVTLRTSERWAVVAFVDPASREIYGDVYLNGEPDSLDAAARACAAAILSTLRQEHLLLSGADGKAPPTAETTTRLRAAIARLGQTWDRRPSRAATAGD